MATYVIQRYVCERCVVEANNAREALAKSTSREFEIDSDCEPLLGSVSSFSNGIEIGGLHRSDCTRPLLFLFPVDESEAYEFATEEQVNCREYVDYHCD